jgi:PTS system nitrogen regulatory IIA component
VQLTVREAARLLQVSEKTVYRWLAEGKLPAQRVGEQYRLNRAELLEWATANRVKASPDLFGEPEEPGAPLPGLEAALEAGGVFYRIEGDTRDEVLHATVRCLRLPEGVDPEFVFEVLRARERLGSTAIGEGIAIPHPRHPLVLHVTRPSITLCFLEHAVDYGALDGRPVSALFTILSPTVRAHLHLLALLAFGLQQAAFRNAVRDQGSRNEILRAARKVDEIAAQSRQDGATREAAR